MDTTNEQRYTTLGMTIETYGTDSQREASIQRLKDELALQGFNITFFIEFESGSVS
jgi:hypothetical protein